MERRVRPGIPGIRGTDHIGFTVPDMEEAHTFLTEIIGCEHVYSLGPFPADPKFMAEKLNVHPETVMQQIRFYRCHTGANFEVFHYSAPDQRVIMPKNSDIGGHHIGLYVEDLDAAVGFLRKRGVRVLGEPTASSGPSEGQRWVYFLAPWGLQFELVSFPSGKAYESSAKTKLWDARCPSS
ncbi:VOC family protein [Nesterenkonia ebinurensis]|uniref:VOC family protein n=1 Tax=Nesterenkonia ebinurensis TaxID=2608252 RepID=UPI00123DDA4A|nr:VOC family protein [Nesterenkonia ebinurensis]